MNALIVLEGGDIEVKMLRVSPQQAEAWLGLNTQNRSIKPGSVTAFARDMAAGRWGVNGATLVFAGPFQDPQKLLDGQNRLHAQVASGATVDYIAVFGVDPEAQGTMDSGAKRTVADSLKINGKSNTIVVAAAAACAIRVQQGKTNGGPIGATNAAVLDFIEENPAIHYSGEIASKYARKADTPPSVVAYTHWVLSQIDPDEAELFWVDAAEKVGLVAGDPVIAMTNWFAEARRNKRRLNLSQMLSAVYRAWNYRRAGKQLKLIKMMSNNGVIAIPTPK